MWDYMHVFFSFGSICGDALFGVRGLAGFRRLGCSPMGCANLLFISQRAGCRSRCLDSSRFFFGASQFLARASQICCLGHPKVPTPDEVERVVVSGIFQKHLSCLVRAAKQFKFAGLDSDTMHTYTGMWNWPLALASRSAHPGDAFNPKRAASSWEAGTFKCQASEALGLVPVFHRLMPKHSYRSSTMEALPRSRSKYWL